MVGLYYPTNEPGKEIVWMENTPLVWKGETTLSYKSHTL